MPKVNHLAIILWFNMKYSQVPVNSFGIIFYQKDSFIFYRLCIYDYRMLLNIKTGMDVRLSSYKNWQGNIKTKLQLLFVGR
jgi:hypothetical protein